MTFLICGGNCCLLTDQSHLCGLVAIADGLPLGDCERRLDGRDPPPGRRGVEHLGDLAEEPGSDLAAPGDVLEPLAVTVEPAQLPHISAVRVRVEHPGGRVGVVAEIVGDIGA